MEINDLLVIVPIFISIPLLVNYYIKSTVFGLKLQLIATVGGFVWMIYALFGDLLSQFVLGVPIADAPLHWYFANELVQVMERGEWGALWDKLGPGNRAYHMYLALLSYFLGATEFSIGVLNAWFAFWGGLIFVRCLRNLFPHGPMRTLIFCCVIFCPSVVFWSSTNLKEGLMYWSICCLFSAAFKDISKGPIRLFGSALPVAGLVAGTLLRPHIMMGWVAGILAVSFFSKGKIKYGVVNLVAIPLLLMGVQQLTGTSMELDAAFETALSHYQTLSTIKEGSYIEYGASGPIFFVSGFLAIFFRPLPWEIHSLRFAFAVIETWTLTLCIVWAWLSGTGRQNRYLLSLPETQAAIIALIWGAILIAYFPNTGLIIRQRVQMIPAILFLAFLPILYRDSLRYRQWFQNVWFRSLDQELPELPAGS